MTLASQLSSDISGVFFNTSEFGVAATYKANSDDSGTECTVLLNLPQSNREQPSNAIDLRSHVAEVLVAIADVASPAEGGFFEIGSQVWRIGTAAGTRPVEYQDESQLIWRCNVTRTS